MPVLALVLLPCSAVAPLVDLVAGPDMVAASNPLLVLTYSLLQNSAA